MTGSKNARSLIVQYLDWQAEEFRARDSEDGRVFIETPFARADGHAFDIEVSILQDGSVRFTDAGETLDELWMQGVALTDATLQDIKKIARRFRVELSASDNILANDGDGGGRQLRDIISAILAISALSEHHLDAERAKLTASDDSVTPTT